MKPSDKDPNKIRLQVFLSRNGVCSRREAMNVVQSGAVHVNGKKITEPSFKVDGRKDSIKVKGKRIHAKVYDYILLYKPKGYVTTKAVHGKQKNVYQLIPRKFHHCATAGRLDQDTEGLLIFTNDGDAVNKLTHPRFKCEKSYQAKISGHLTDQTKRKLERGIILDGKKTAPARISNVHKLKDQTELKINIREGRNRQIRYMFAKVGHMVVNLKRISQGPIRLGKQKMGTYRVLTSAEQDALQKL